MGGDADAAAPPASLQAILDYVPVGVIVIDTAGDVTYQNEAAAEMTGDACSLTDEQRRRLLDDRQCLTGVHWQPDSQAYTIDGVPVPGGAALVIRDVSEQRHARQALKEREEKFRLLTEHAPTGIAILRDGECIYANHAFTTIIGEGSVTGTRFLDHVHPGDRETARKLLKSARTGTPPPCILRLQSYGGDTWLECTATSITYEGKPAMLVNVMDVTRHKQLENEYISSRRRMEQAVERERRFIEDVSHHFFNPLCIAKGYLNLSIREADPETRRKLRITRDAVDRVESVVKNVVRDGTICE